MGKFLVLLSNLLAKNGAGRRVCGMKKYSLTEEPTVLEAVDNLSSMAELDLEEVALAKEDESKGLKLKISRWLDTKDEEKTIFSVKGTLKVIHDYLKHVYTKDFKKLKELEMQKGVRSIIALANEAAQKIDRCTGMFHGKASIVQSKEYRDLMDFYEGKILKRFEETIKTEEEWEEAWKTPEDAADLQRRGLKDLETVTRDRDYELFYITKEDGSKFYNKNLIRHMRLVADFDHLVGDLEGGDPLLQIKVVQDRVAMETALFLKEELRDDLDEWIRKAGKFRDDPLVQTLYRAIMALLLTSNQRNLLTHTTGKASIRYFNDFLFALRESLYNVDYLSIIDNSSLNLDPFYGQMIYLMHRLCFQLFTQKVNYSHAAAIFTRLIQKDTGVHTKSTRSSIALWNMMLDYHESLENELKKHPNGPLFKVLDILHDVDESDFDPFIQEDRPQYVCSITMGKKKIDVVKMACPTTQKLIHKAAVIPEFIGFMRYIAFKKEKVLLVNFQDRTSWKEFSRSVVVESLQKNAEFDRNLEIITIPKHTDFYFQSDEYIQNSNASDFKKIFLEQIKGEEACGFYFPRHYFREELHAFSKNAFEVIHEIFFASKDILSRKNRLDFIDLFYNILMFKALEMGGANYILFSGKDGVDIASTTSAAFFATAKLLSGSLEWKEEEKDYFAGLIFLPALLIRERPVDIRPLNRIISALALLSAELELNAKATLQALDGLIMKDFSATIRVSIPESQ